NPNLAYAAYSGFNAYTPSTVGHLFKTTDGGFTWTNVSAGLPDVPTNAVVVLAAPNNNIVYVGTDIGVYKSVDGGASWSSLNTGLPRAVVNDLVVGTGGGVTTLWAVTHGHSVYNASVVIDTPPTISNVG